MYVDDPRCRLTPWYMDLKCFSERELSQKVSARWCWVEKKIMLLPSVSGEGCCGSSHIHLTAWAVILSVELWKHHFCFYRKKKIHRKHSLCILLHFQKAQKKVIVPILHIDIDIDIFLYFWICLFPVGYRICSILCNNLYMGFFCFVCNPSSLKCLYISAVQVTGIPIFHGAAWKHLLY